MFIFYLETIYLKKKNEVMPIKLLLTDYNLLGPEKYWTYRWIHAVDGTSGHPFILEVFSSSQPEIFSRICPSKSTVSAPV